MPLPAQLRIRGLRAGAGEHARDANVRLSQNELCHSLIKVSRVEIECRNDHPITNPMNVLPHYAFLSLISAMRSAFIPPFCRELHESSVPNLFSCPAIFWSSCLNSSSAN